MSTHWNSNSHPSLGPETPREKPSKEPLWKRKWVPFAALGFGMLLVGIGIGGSGKAEAVPAPTATVTASPSPAPTVTKSVEVTPKSCLEAMDLSEQGFTLSAEAIGYMGDALTAAGNIDVAGLKQANADLEELNPKMKLLTAPMKKAVAECREGAE